MTSHRVVVFTASVDGPVPGSVEKAAVAVCFDRPWRGGVWGRAQTAVDDANVHRHTTSDSSPDAAVGTDRGDQAPETTASVSTHNPAPNPAAPPAAR